MQTTTATKVYTDLHESLETIRNTEPQSLANMEVGDEWRQGDVRIIRLPDDFGKRHDLTQAKPETQVAPGTTQGSQHCLDTVKGKTFWRLDKATALDGPIVHCSKTWSLLHPTHGNCVDAPAGWYAFPGQRTFAEELRRVAD